MVPLQRTVVVYSLFYFLLVLPVFSSAQTSAQSDGILPLKGKVVALSGTVKFRNSENIIWQELKLDQELASGDRIQTGKDGQLKVEMNNGNVLYLKPDSEIFIEKLWNDPVTGKYQSVFETIKAKIKAEVNDRKDLKTFEIRTPTAVAGVRGTVFYVNASKESTEVFVERGNVNLRNNISDRDRNIRPGFSSVAGEKGEVSKPFVPPPEKMQEFQQVWEPLPPPPPGALPPPPDGQQPPADGQQPPPDGQKASPDGQKLPPGGTYTGGVQPPTMNQMLAMFTGPKMFASEFQQLQQQYTQNQQNFLFDRQLSQETTKTEYINQTTTLASGNPSGDSDGDGILNSSDLDDDNDFLLDTAEIAAGTDPLNKDTDADGMTDWEELVLHQTNPKNTDSDGDTITDWNDPFPNNAAVGYSISPIRIFRYDKINTTAIPGLRTEIQTMLADSNERQKDYIMDRISDAQAFKVLKDSSGNWTRIEQYIFRPAPQEIDILNITFKGALAAPYSSMHVQMEFNNTLNSLTSSQIKNLPWDKYFSGTTGVPINYGTTTAPTLFPVIETVKFENTGGVNYAKIDRTLANGMTCTPFCTQTITGEGIVINNPGFGANAFADTFTINPPPTGSDSSTNSPAHITYVGQNPQGWGVPQVNFTIYPIDTNGNMIGDFTFTTIWDVLGTNLTGFNNIGDGNYLQLDVAWSGGATSQVIYIPIKNSDTKWRGTAQWPEELTW
jgi:hypothetical protein